MPKDEDSNVVSLAEAKEAREPHMSGEAKCLDCGHEWVAVKRVDGDLWLDCPECGFSKGRFKFNAVRDLPHWKCNCGNDLFCLTRDGMYCPMCGTWVTGWDE